MPIRSLLFVSFLLLPLFVGAQSAQRFSTLSSRWADSFVEWELYAVPIPDSTQAAEQDAEPPEETLSGEIKLRWLNMREDWTEWEYEYLGERGSIRRKWKDDPSDWELRAYNGAIVSMKTAWVNDFSEWRVTDNSISFVFGSRWKNQFDEWQAKDNNHGAFYLYTLKERDPRDWAIDDQTSAEVSNELKLAMIFLALFYGAPKQ